MKFENRYPVNFCIKYFSIIFKFKHVFENFKLYNLFDKVIIKKFKKKQMNQR